MKSQPISTVSIEKNEPLQALIYNRVSSSKQDREGAGLESQEHRCIQFAESKGYVIDSSLVFHDRYTGGGNFMQRPAMRELLNYIDGNPNRKYVVIFDDLKRFARDTIFHFGLRAAFNSRHVKVECLNYNFDDSPEGIFVETVLAAQNQLEREQNQRQVLQKQRARLESGFWAFRAPIGYSMKKVLEYSGKIAVRNETAPILKEAIEGFANYRFLHFTDMAQFLKDNGVFKKARADRYIETVAGILKNPFYIGYIEYLPWGVGRRKGFHAPLIDESVYYRNQERLHKPTEIKRIRKDDNPEFELRRLVNCIYCKRPLTAAFSKGRNALYPYYLCQTKKCIMNKKSIRRSKLNNDFKDVLQGLTPTYKSITTFIKAFRESCKNAFSKLKNDIAMLDAEALRIEQEINKYVGLAGSAKTDTLRSRYEEKVELLETEMNIVRAKQAISIDLNVPYRTIVQKVMEMGKNPYRLWVLSDLKQKKKLFYFYFDQNIEYDLKSSYRTAKPSILYRVLSDFSNSSVNVDNHLNLSNQFTELWNFIQKWSEEFAQVENIHSSHTNDSNDIIGNAAA